MDRGPANEKEETEYKTPPTCILLDLLLKNRRPSGPFNEVWPNLIISDARTATDLVLLKTLRVTHVVNAAHGPAHIDTGSTFYSDAHIQYYGIEAPDSRDFDLSAFFHTTADFIHTAVTRDSGKVLVHCARGKVLVHLMIYKRLTVAEAIEDVRSHRTILPNVGFLEQLRDLDAKLAVQKKRHKDSHDELIRKT